MKAAIAILLVFHFFLLIVFTQSVKITVRLKISHISYRKTEIDLVTDPKSLVIIEMEESVSDICRETGLSGLFAGAAGITYLLLFRIG